MKLGGKIEICVLAGVLASGGALAAASRVTDTPYNAIIERNVFNLHPPAPRLDPSELVKPTPPPKITLTGITTILGKKVAFLTTPALKPGTQPENAMLAEGQALNDIEVQSIDEKAGIVKVKNHGEDETLDFEHNGAKPSGAPPPMYRPNGFPPPGPAPRGVVPIPNPESVVRPLRSLSRPVSENNYNGGSSPYAGGIAYPNNFSSQNAAPPMSREETVALIELQRAKYMEENDPTAKLLPPTELTPEMTGGSGQGPTPAPQ